MKDVWCNQFWRYIKWHYIESWPVLSGNQKMKAGRLFWLSVILMFLYIAGHTSVRIDHFSYPGIDYMYFQNSWLQTWCCTYSLSKHGYTAKWFPPVSFSKAVRGNIQWALDKSITLSVINSPKVIDLQNIQLSTQRSRAGSACIAPISHGTHSYWAAFPNLPVLRNSPSWKQKL